MCITKYFQYYIVFYVELCHYMGIGKLTNTNIIKVLSLEQSIQNHDTSCIPHLGYFNFIAIRKEVRK